MSLEMLDWAWNNYFARDDKNAPADPASLDTE
jgi:hypothetical protein